MESVIATKGTRGFFVNCRTHVMAFLTRKKIAATLEYSMGTGLVARLSLKSLWTGDAALDLMLLECVAMMLSLSELITGKRI